MLSRSYHDSLIGVVHHSNQHIYCYEGGTDSIGEQKYTANDSGEVKRWILHRYFVVIHFTEKYRN